MQFEHEGIVMWYGTPDTPAPNESAEADREINITVGVKPIDASNQINILYRVNQGTLQKIPARWLRNNVVDKAQYFRASLPPFQAGSIVGYSVICRCAGQQFPKIDQAQELQSSFQVVVSMTESASDKLSKPSSVSSSNIKLNINKSPIATKEIASPDPESDRRAVALDALNRGQEQTLPVHEPLKTKTEKVEELVSEEAELMAITEPSDFITHNVRIQLLDKATANPLSGYAVRVFDIEAGAETALDYESSDIRGFLTISYTEPRKSAESKDNKRDSVKQLRLHVYDLDDEEVYQTNINVNSIKEQVVKVQVPPAPEPPSLTLTEIASKARLNLPTKLTQELQKRNIRTLAELRQAGGLGKLEEIKDSNDDPAVKRLAGHVNLSTLSSSIEEDADLMDKGFSDLTTIAKTPRRKFVNINKEKLGEERAAKLHVEARTQVMYLNNVLTEHRVNQANGFKVPTAETGSESIKMGYLDPDALKCGCKDCESAVSPLAYLADLLDYALWHIRDDDNLITLKWLEDRFHQPFGALPVTCEAMNEKVRQVRLCVEVLRSYLGHIKQESTSTSKKPGGLIFIPNPPETPIKPVGDVSILLPPDPEPPPLEPKFTDEPPKPYIYEGTPLSRAEIAYRRAAYEMLLNQIGTSYDELRLVRSADEETRQQLAERLGIDSKYIDTLLIDVKRTSDSSIPIYTEAGVKSYPLTEASLEQMFGLQDTTRGPMVDRSETPLLEQWRLDYLRTLWEGQDFPTDAYRPQSNSMHQNKLLQPAYVTRAKIMAEQTHTLPIIDPDVISEQDIRNPVEGNPVFDLWKQRRQEVDTILKKLRSTEPEVNGWGPVLRILGEPLANLETLVKRVKQGVEVDDTTEQIKDLGLTIESFTRLMEIVDKEQQIEPSERNEVFAIITQAQKVKMKYPAWIVQERNKGINLGPQEFVIALEEPAHFQKWLASSRAREEWQKALLIRMQTPTIDPHLINEEHFKYPFANNLAYEIWIKRRSWADERKKVLKQAREGQDNLLSGLQALFEKSTLGISLKTLDELVEEQDTGHDISKRLEQLSLPFDGFIYLVRIRKLAAAVSPISDSEWDGVYDIVLQGEKQREFAEWQEEERKEGLTLSPDYFTIPEPTEEFFPDEPEPLLKWLTSWIARRNWENNLKARIDQENAIIQALKDAVSATEEATLPMLRDALVKATDAEGHTLETKAKRITDRFLIDAKTDGCQMTTRVSQAIETLQVLFWSVRTEQSKDTYPKLTLDLEDFEEAWKWLGSFASWRAAMFVFLYPENIMIPSLRSRQTPAFCNMIESIRTNQPLKPANAFNYASEYADYFRDVCNLEVQASCVTSTRARKDGCKASILDQYQVRFHMFAIAERSGKVYTSSFVRLSSNDTQDFWKPIQDLHNVIKILGAVPYQLPSGGRFIFLFVKLREDLRNRLVFIRFNLESLEWDNEWNTLELPPGANDFTAVVSQNRYGTGGTTVTGSPEFAAPGRPTIPDPDHNPINIVIRTPEGMIYVRHLNRNGTNWAGNQWIPLFGKILAEKYVEVCAIIQRSVFEYVLILRNKNGYLEYRVFFIGAGRDDGYWRQIVKGKFIGAFIWPASKNVYVFFRDRDIDKTKYSVIPTVGSLFDNGKTIDSIRQLEEWLNSVVGVSLEDFFVEINYKLQLIKGYKKPRGIGPIYYTFPLPFTYEGNLLNLLTMTINSDHHSMILAKIVQKDVPEEDLPYPETKRTIRSFILTELKKNGIFELEKIIQEINDFHESFGEWKLADWYVRQFETGERFYGDEEKEEELSGKGLVNTLNYLVLVTNAEIKFLWRGTSEIITFSDDAPLNPLQVISSTENEESGPQANSKTLLLNVDSSFYRVKLERLGYTLVPEKPKKQSVLPFCSSLFDIVPWSSGTDLMERKERIISNFKQNSGEPSSLLTYLEEVFYSVPVHIALQLQKNHYYNEALDWFRLIYDFSAKLENRIVYTTGIPLRTKSIERDDDWLFDPLDPHRIAKFRPGTLNRFTLISIVRCFLDYADAKFTQDTSESVARARVLYMTALELIDQPLFQQQLGWCQELIGSIGFEVGPKRLIAKARKELSKIKDYQVLNVAVEAVKEILREDGAEIDKFRKVNDVISESTKITSQHKTLNTIVKNKYDILTNTYAALLAEPTISKATSRIARKAKKSFEQTVFASTESAKPFSGSEEMETSSFLVGRNPTDGKSDPAENGETDEIRTLKVKPQTPRLAFFDPSIVSSGTGAAGMKPNFEFIDYEYAPDVSVDFCIPPNPVMKALQRRAELALYKLRHCLNIAGMKRELAPYAAPTDTVSGLPTIGAGDQLVLPGVPLNSISGPLRPTLYRYNVLIERAKQIIQLAAQIEVAMLSAIEKRDSEEYTLFQARQNVETARSGIRLQDLRVQEAISNVILSHFQQGRAQIQVDHYSGLLTQGLIPQEKNALEHMRTSANLQTASAGFSFAAAATYQAAAGAAFFPLSVNSPAGKISNALSLQASAFSAMASGLSSTAGVFSTKSSISSSKASYERRKQDWQLQKNIAEQDTLIAAQQSQIAQNHVRVVNEERAIAALQADHAQDTIEFLANKFTNVALYDWMGNVLEGVYSYFLQQATSTAKLAEIQLGFQRQEISPVYIQADYWETPGRVASTASNEGGSSDRRGLTGSARLLQDIYQLDQYAFETDKRKLQLSKTISLSRLDPIAFQRFHETGVMNFATPMELFDRDFPGHYLRLIKQVRTSVIALIPPSQGINATLSTTGTSSVVIGGDFFQKATVNRGPESVALSSPFNATGIFELNMQPEMYLPFEGLGVETFWEFRMPKASNQFDYSTITDVIITFDYTALNSYNYRHEVIQKLDSSMSADRYFSFRQELADQWYDLHNPDQMATPMTVRFKTRREDFPPNIDELKIQHVVLYFAFENGSQEYEDIIVDHLYFKGDNSFGSVGGGSQTNDGIISTRRGNAGSWLSMIGLSPFGEWELALKDTPEIRRLFSNEKIEDILFVITFGGTTPKYPV